MKKIRINPRIIFISSFIAIMVFILGIMYSSGSIEVENGKADLSRIDFSQNKLVDLDGFWEFYWGRLLTSDDFTTGQKPQMDSFMKVPNTWDVRQKGTKSFPHRGFATYRLQINYPASLKDPALRISNVSATYRLYANGRLITEVGKLSVKLSDVKDDEKTLILDLPKNTQELELIVQVANLNYPRGGLRESPVFGSKRVLERQRIILLGLQLFFIGSVFIFGIYYFVLFLLQTKNRTALFFSMLCFITALRSLIWGEVPLVVFFPNRPFVVGVYINYITGYNLMPILILFICSIYPSEYKKKTLGLILLPIAFFDLLLALTSTPFMSEFTNYLYLLVLLQMIYIISVLIKAVLHKRDNGFLMFIVICVYILTILGDILHYKGIGGINISHLFLYGNFVVMMAMSFVQAKQQANTYRKLVLYNETLVEADRLKDKIMATEMSFLQAQIKPHFLYNALNAIANICEKDSKKAGKLIIDLAIYLRGSLEFNNLEKKMAIEKELEFVDTYFNIEQTRFGQKIKLKKEIDIPLDYRIPVLILQPLVENAVQHGISKKLEGGTIYIRMTRVEEGIYIEIEDDGVGIQRQKLATLLGQERIDSGVGLHNIHHRLLRLYGCGIDISSEVGQGTLVKILIKEMGKQV